MQPITKIYPSCNILPFLVSNISDCQSTLFHGDENLSFRHAVNKPILEWVKWTISDRYTFFYPYFFISQKCYCPIIRIVKSADKALHIPPGPVPIDISMNLSGESRPVNTF